jgi:predicted SprT family Zn-dependent metalloprotease
MPLTKRQQGSLSQANHDLFEAETLARPAPATMYTKIRQQARPAVNASARYDLVGDPSGPLPSVRDLYEMFDHFNGRYFQGQLPRVRIEYSTRMRSAGFYLPHQKIIRLGRMYHEIFPEELVDTLKHEMIHILHLDHGRKFKAEAARIGASLKAKSHPLLRTPPKYVYCCPACGKEYPRQKRLRMASCGDCSPGGKFDRHFQLKLKWSRKRAAVAS